MLKVVEIELEQNEDHPQRRYVLIDSQGQLVQPAMQYMKYLDNTGKSINTLRAYCYHLKLYFEFLESRNANVQDVNLTFLGQFIAWLRSPSPQKVTILHQQVEARAPQTINLIVNCVLGMYDFLLRNNYLDKDVTQMVSRQISGRHRTFKPFLHHISKHNSMRQSVLKQKVSKKTIKVLTNRQLQTLFQAIPHVRDRLLFYILLEGGLRISEVLALKFGDFDLSNRSIQIKKSKTAAGIRTVYVSPEAMNCFQDWLIKMPEDVDSDFVFITLRGKNYGNLLSYKAVVQWVKRLIHKTGIDFMPHILRHTYATTLFNQGMDLAVLQRLLGHQHYQTTVSMYLHPSDEEIRKHYDKTKQRQSSNQEVKPK